MSALAEQLVATVQNKAHLWKKGQTGNPLGKKTRQNILPPVTKIVAQPKEKHNQVLLLQAYELAVRQGYDLIVDLSKSGKKNFNEIRNRMISWGVAADKVLQRDQDGGMTIRIPTALAGRISGVIALKVEPVNTVDSVKTVVLPENQNQEQDNTTKLLDKSYPNSVHE